MIQFYSNDLPTREKLFFQTLLIFDLINMIIAHIQYKYVILYNL